LTPSFSERLIGLIAEVGHIYPHAVQFNWQPLVPSVKLSAGVHRFSKPPKIPDGTIIFVGHIRMHCPHLMHLPRKSGSGREPGGLTRFTFFVEVPALNGNNCMAMSPEREEMITPLRVRSGLEISPAPDSVAPYFNTPSLQLS